MNWFFHVSISRQRIRFGTPLFVVEWMNGSMLINQMARSWGYRILVLPKRWVVEEGAMYEFRWYLERERKRELLEI